MKIYIVSERANDEQPNNAEHTGYSFFSSRKAAEQHVQDYRETHDMEILTANFPISKRGMLAALNKLGGHPDNG
jgi:hypothetical protein